MVLLKLLWLPVLAASASLVAASAATACSPRPGYVRPSNYELVQLVDAIAIATAVREKESTSFPGVEFSLESSVKGAAPERLLIGGARIRDAPPSNSAGLPEPHPHAYHGMCNRTAFRAGGRYLLFLQRGKDGTWHEAGFPFSRVNEDYAGEEDAWVRAVRRYVRLQARLGPIEQLSALNRIVETKTDPVSGPLTEPELNDLEAHLTLLSPYKPTAYLLAAWRLLDRDRNARSVAPDRQSLLAAPVERFLLTATPDGQLQPANLKRFLLTSLVVGDHQKAAPLIDSLLEDRSSDPRLLGPAIRFVARHRGYKQAFRWMESRLLAALSTLEGYDARALIGDVVMVQTAEFTSPTELWLGDPHAASAWPELALALHWQQVRLFGEVPIFGFEDAIAVIPVSDYRERPSVALALAGSQFGQKVLDWSLAELNDDAKRRAWEARAEPDAPIDRDPAWLPLRILLTADQREGHSALAAIFCQSAKRRHLLIAMLGAHGGDTHGMFLDRIAATPSLSEPERELLAGTMIRFQAEHGRQNDQMPWSFAKSTLREVEAALGRSKVRAEPLSCPS